MIGEVVDGKTGPIALSCVAGFTEDRLGGRPTTPGQVFAIPSPCNGLTRPTASPTSRTRPAAGVVRNLIPILSQPPRRSSSDHEGLSSRRWSRRRCSWKTRGAPGPPFLPPCGLTSSRSRDQRWPRLLIQERSTRTPGKACHGVGSEKTMAGRSTTCGRYERTAKPRDAWIDQTCRRSRRGSLRRRPQ